MERIQEIDFDYYARWYLRRESREKWRLPVPSISTARKVWMNLWHAGKMVPWFAEDARWSICRLTEIADLENLLVLSSPWTRRQELVVPEEPRLLVNAARRAQQKHFRNLPNDRLGQYVSRVSMVRCLRLDRWFPQYVTFADPRLLFYYHRHQAGFTLDGNNCIVLRSLEDDEREEMSQAGVKNTHYYLHDGFGRMVSYLALLQQNMVPFRPVTAIVADRKS